MRKHGVGVITPTTVQSEKRTDACDDETVLHKDNVVQSQTPANAADAAVHQTNNSDGATSYTQTMAQAQLVIKVDDAIHSDSDSSGTSSSDAVDTRSKRPSYKRNVHNRNATPATPTSRSTAAFAGFSDIHGYGSSPATRGRPDVPSNISNDKVPLTFNESQRVKTRQRQRLLHSVEDLDIVQTHESMSRVPWAELDTLIALKEELRAAKAVKSMLHK
jgi:hypothetical protein